MAQTLANGVVIPAPGDRISAQGVAEMRTLGASVNTGLAVAQAQVAQADAQSRARDADLADQVAGMEGMTYVGAWESGTSYRINDVVTHGGDSWARLTAGSDGEPGVDSSAWGLVARRGDGGGFGALSETVVTGLYETVDSGFDARLAALERDTGWRDVSGEGWQNGWTGKLHVRRVGNMVEYRFSELNHNGATSPTMYIRALPGFNTGQGNLIGVLGGNPAGNPYASDLVTSSGSRNNIWRANHTAASIDGRAAANVVFITEEPWPTTLPGDPA